MSPFDSAIVVKHILQDDVLTDYPRDLYCYYHPSTTHQAATVQQFARRYLGDLPEASLVIIGYDVERLIGEAKKRLTQLHGSATDELGDKAFLQYANEILDWKEIGISASSEQAFAYLSAMSLATYKAVMTRAFTERGQERSAEALKNVADSYFALIEATDSMRYIMIFSFQVEGINRVNELLPDAKLGQLRRNSLRKFGKERGSDQTIAREPEWERWRKKAKELWAADPSLTRKKSETARRVKKALELPDTLRTISDRIFEQK